MWMRFRTESIYLSLNFLLNHSRFIIISVILVADPEHGPIVAFHDADENCAYF